jgi:hypothetical protein
MLMELLRKELFLKKERKTTVTVGDLNIRVLELNNSVDK